MTGFCHEATYGAWTTPAVKLPFRSIEAQVLTSIFAIDNSVPLNVLSAARSEDDVSDVVKPQVGLLMLTFFAN
jgi:hypothetical protein